MTFILFDDETRFHLLPFTHTRPVADIRCGILTMRERWEKWLNEKTGTLTPSHLQTIFPLISGSDNILINGAVFADRILTEAVMALKPGEKLVSGNTVLAGRVAELSSGQDLSPLFQGLSPKPFDSPVSRLQNIWDIFSLNDQALRADYELITKGRISAEIPHGVQVSGTGQVFLEKDARILPGTIINALTGPVYLGASSEILEGSLIRGPLALCEGAVIKMGAKIYGATTIGPGCKVGGELSNVVFMANSNKGHDGYLGNSVIGAWCNLGADTNCSNLKNNYGEVSVWDEHSQSTLNTGLQFCGLFMGDHSKTGINTMLNTGTVIGVSANVFGPGFPDKFIPSFTWGGADRKEEYQFPKAMETAERMLARRGQNMISEEIGLYQYIFDLTAPQREA
jgi:UDP-N-acetylglucosamine diphosphorylase/glucosamine-1-phosphate N-acetyltransferase